MAQQAFPGDYNLVVVPRKVQQLELSQVADCCSRFLYVVSETEDYRRAARSLVNPTDQVLEVGASYGVCSVILGRHAKSVLAVDISAKALEEARRRCELIPTVMFEECNALRDTDRLFELSQGVTCVFIDVGGDRLLGECLRLVQSCIGALAPRLICVKSRSLWNFGSQKACDNRDSSFLFEELFATCGAIGRITSCATSYDNLRVQATRAGSGTHPLDYALCFVPGSDVAICRYYNFFSDGCRKGEACGYDHDHCYFCKELHHRALECPVGPTLLKAEKTK